MRQPALLALLRRDRLVLVGGLLGMVLLAWVYLLTGAGMDMSMPGMAMMPTAWSPSTALIMFAMWWIMMIAMMVPSAAPTVLFFSRITAQQAEPRRTTFAPWLFLGGYLAVWAAFSAVATALQWGLDGVGLLGMDMRLASAPLAGAILIAAGLYQLTPVKTACLEHCQSPLFFLSTHWQPGAAGAFRMGARHGAYCLGCCWVLMALLFLGGVMNLVWIAGLAVYVALEKLAPGGRLLSRVAGVLCALSGVGLLTSSL